MQDFTKVKGQVELVLKDSQGNVKEHVTIPNLVVTTGLGHITSRLAGVSQAVMSHMAVGTSATAAALADTTLGAEVGRVALTSTTPSGSTILYVASFGAGVATGALQEAGVLNDGAAGTLLCRTVFPVVNKGASDTLQISWTITVS